MSLIFNSERQKTPQFSPSGVFAHKERQLFHFWIWHQLWSLISNSWKTIYTICLINECYLIRSYGFNEHFNLLNVTPMLVISIRKNLVQVNKWNNWRDNLFGQISDPHVPTCSWVLSFFISFKKWKYGAGAGLLKRGAGLALFLFNFSKVWFFCCLKMNLKEGALD